MSELIGKRISHYRIVEQIGQGGMGVVYKAEDTKLERTIALKFLSQSLIGGEEENERFKREAKAAAALNHPNIAHVYAVDEVDGQAFIAMEYIDGNSLHEIVGRNNGSPLPLDDAIDYATQISAGLQAAHEKGIVHRDIKSANIMVTDKGVVKIMDFGLAKLANRTKMTVQGTTLGTIAYMSAEQAQGQSVDHRSDIWSLGVVLYEMLSGQMPFKGDYEQAVIYSILHEEPEPLTALRSGLPMKLEEIVNKLLAKNPRDRYQNIMELPVDLKNVTVQKTTVSQIGTSGIRETIQREKRLNVQVKYSYKTILTIAASAILTFLLTWTLKIGYPPLPAPIRPNKMVVTLPEKTSLYFSGSNRMAISPDGRDMVYIGFREDGGVVLFLKRAGNFDITELAGTFAARSPFFSPDGRWIGYLNQRTKGIYKILVDGGEPLKVASYQSSHNYASATWAPDNTIVFAGDVLKQIPDSGGEPAILTKIKRKGELHLYPHMLPDGKTVLFTVGYQNAELNTYRLALYGFGDENYRVILDEDGYNAVYSATGHILYGRANRLMAVPFDLKNLKIAGVPSPVLGNVQTKFTGSMSYALSREGTIIYVPGTGTENELRSVLSVDLSGKASDFFDLKKKFEFARYSPDGKYVAFSIDEENAENIWIYHVEGGAINQLTFYENGGVRFFAWSPDSKRLAYATTDEDSTNSIYVKRIDDNGNARKIFTSPSVEPIVILDWSNDGDKLLFNQAVRGNSFDIFVYSFQDGSAKPFLATPSFEGQASFSPNGKWLVYMSFESGARELYVRPYPKSRGGYGKYQMVGVVKGVGRRMEKRYTTDMAMKYTPLRSRLQARFQKAILKRYLKEIISCVGAGGGIFIRMATGSLCFRTCGLPPRNKRYLSSRILMRS